MIPADELAGYRLRMHAESVRLMRRNLLTLGRWHWVRRRRIRDQLALIALALYPTTDGHAFVAGGDDSTFGPRGTWCAHWVNEGTSEEDQCGMPAGAHQAPKCCEFHDAPVAEGLTPSLCAPDDLGGYCCDDCPTLAAAAAGGKA